MLNHDRYRLVDKLGYGGYSTIWLARDVRKGKYVAVKVATANTSTSMHETSLLRFLGNSPSRTVAGIIPQLIDDFWVVGPNGRHRCIVTPLAQMSLFNSTEASTSGLFRPRVAQSIIAQLIRGVAHIHSKDNVHGGKLCALDELRLADTIPRYPFR